MGHFIVRGLFTQVKSPMNIHGGFYTSKIFHDFIVHVWFYPSRKIPDSKMPHQLFTLSWMISNILTFHFCTFSVMYTFYFYIDLEELIFYKIYLLK